jgi:hypothetical protein
VKHLPVILEDVRLHQRQHAWFMHDGASTHFLHTVRHHLNRTLGEQWTGLKGTVNWPARSPDLNTLDFGL